MADNVGTKEIIADYNSIYATSGLRTNSAYYRWILKLLNPMPNTKLLDVSCGEGILLKLTAESNRGIKTFGLDISSNAAAISKKNSPNSKIISADGQKIPFPDNYFDYVTCLGSLEHYLSVETGMKEIARVAKAEAKFIIALPNSVSIDFVLHAAKTGDKTKEDFQIIERSATRAEWINLLTENGFIVNKVYSSNLWPELFKEGTFKVKSVKKFLRRLAIKTFCPVNLAREFVFVCSKKKD